MVRKQQKRKVRFLRRAHFRGVDGTAKTVYVRHTKAIRTVLLMSNTVTLY